MSCFPLAYGGPFNIYKARNDEESSTNSEEEPSLRWSSVSTPRSSVSMRLDSDKA